MAGRRGSPPLATFSRILVPLDGSSDAECALARVCNADLVLVRVPADPAHDLLDSNAWMLEELRGDIRVEAQTYMCVVAHKLRAEGFRVSTHVEDGHVATKILEIAAPAPT